MKRHPFDPLSFAGGVIFVMVSASVAFGSNMDIRPTAWLVPASFLVLGIGILVATLRGFSRTTENVGDKASGSLSDVEE